MSVSSSLTAPPGKARKASPVAVLLAMPWINFTLRRLAGLAGTFAVLVVLAFLIIQLIPGDPAVALAGADATSQDVAVLRTQLGLDLPVIQQLVNYVVAVLGGDLGMSFQYGQPVADIVLNRLPFTATIALIGIVLVLLIAVPLGMLVGVMTRGGRRRWLDNLFGFGTGIVDSIPSYIMATLLVVLFGLGIGFIPVLPPAYVARFPAASFVLPIAALIIGPVCTISRVVRRETSVVLEKDFMRTARGWRIPAARLYLKYALSNLLTTTLTLSGLILSGMLGGALIIESVFALPGLGSGIIKAILDRDFPLIQGMVLILGMMAAIINLLVDVALGIIDPRTLGAQRADD